MGRLHLPICNLSLCPMPRGGLGRLRMSLCRDLSTPERLGRLSETTFGRMTLPKSYIFQPILCNSKDRILDPELSSRGRSAIVLITVCAQALNHSLHGWRKNTRASKYQKRYANCARSVAPWARRRMSNGSKASSAHRTRKQWRRSVHLASEKRASRSSLAAEQLLTTRRCLTCIV